MPSVWPDGQPCPWRRSPANRSEGAWDEQLPPSRLYRCRHFLIRRAQIPRFKPANAVDLPTGTPASRYLPRKRTKIRFIPVTKYKNPIASQLDSGQRTLRSRAMIPWLFARFPGLVRPADRPAPRGLRRRQAFKFGGQVSIIYKRPPST